MSKLLEEPWGFPQKKFPQDFSYTQDLSGKGSPRIVTPIGNRVSYKTVNNLLPRVSFPFKWGKEIMQSYSLPSNHKFGGKQRIDFSIKVKVGLETIEVNQTEMIGRYKDDISEEETVSSYLVQWIDWLVHSYQELGDAAVLQGESVFTGLSRRKWKSIRSQFLSEGTDEALMSLVVEVSRDLKLLRAFEAISMNPRKVLKRVRQELLISQISQLDSACIRDYATRPGRSIAEKAGPRQKLLGLNRVVFLCGFWIG